MGFIINGENLVKYEEEPGVFEVKIPEGVSSIAFDAFWDCKNIKKLEFPGTVKEIRDFFLQRCISLEKIVLNEGTEMIDWQVFWDMSQYAPIKSVRLPDSCGCFCRWTPPLDSFCLEDGIVYTVDKKRIIYCLPGVEEEYRIPDSVESIDQYAFSHTKRRAICVPEGFVLSKDAFFDLKDFSNYVYNKEVLRINLQSKDKMPAYYSEYMKISKVSGMDLAYVVAFQSGKGWESAVNEKVSSDNGLVNEAISYFKTLLPGNKENIFQKTVNFVLQYIQYVSGKDIQEFIDFLKECKSKSLELLSNDIGVQKALKQLKEEGKLEKVPAEVDFENELYMNPIEEMVRVNWKGSKIVSELKEIIKTGITYSDNSGVSSPEAVIFVVASYANQLDDSVKYHSMYKTEYVKTHFDEIADKVAEKLNLKELQELLESLVFNGKNINSAIILAYGRFASSNQISKLIAQMNKWKNYGEFGAIGRKQIIIARGALMLSDHREAIMAVDKTKALVYYASVRGTDEETIRYRVLSDFGFDKNGRKTLELGNNKVIISLANDLSLIILDEVSGKTVKSIPKKDADPDLYDKAKAEYAELKKNIKKVISGHSKLLFEEFLSGKEYTYQKWVSTYIDNIVLNAVGALVVWKQGDKYFVLNRTGAPIDEKGAPVKLTDEPIFIAHPMEMDKKDIALWQGYFTIKNMKQPFEQMWEPTYNLSSIKEDRYVGCTIPVFKMVGKDKEGISSWGISMYSEDYGFTLTDCKLDFTADTGRIVPGITNDAKYTLGSLKILKNSRYANHIIYLLDKWTIEDRIMKDEVFAVDVLDGFTMAQIIDFINVAQNAKAHNVLALLMDYKNRKYANYDLMDKYILAL